MKIGFARLELLKIAHEVQWYERRLRGLGEDLERELDARFERIAQAPSAFRATLEDTRARRAPRADAAVPFLDHLSRDERGNRRRGVRPPEEATRLLEQAPSSRSVSR